MNASGQGLYLTFLIFGMLKEEMKNKFPIELPCNTVYEYPHREKEFNVNIKGVFPFEIAAIAGTKLYKYVVMELVLSGILIQIF